jgi:hypothetical protein
VSEKKSKKGRHLTPDELKVYDKPFWVPGKPVMLVQSFGWCVVGFYVRHETPLQIRLAHINHFRNAGVDYGVIAREGPGADCEWRYEGDGTVNVNHVLRNLNYGGEVPTSRIR